MKLLLLLLSIIVSISCHAFMPTMCDFKQCAAGEICRYGNCVPTRRLLQSEDMCPKCPPGWVCKWGTCIPIIEETIPPMIVLCEEERRCPWGYKCVEVGQLCQPVFFPRRFNPENVGVKKVPFCDCDHPCDEDGLCL